jgi:hypothetical protein
MRWAIRVSAYGVSRSDGICGWGGLIGTEVDW